MIFISLKSFVPIMMMCLTCTHAADHQQDSRLWYMHTHTAHNTRQHTHTRTQAPGGMSSLLLIHESRIIKIILINDMGIGHSAIRRPPVPHHSKMVSMSISSAEFMILLSSKISNTGLAYLPMHGLIRPCHDSMTHES